jgi:hypothetical protein
MGDEEKIEKLLGPWREFKEAGLEITVGIPVDDPDNPPAWALETVERARMEGIGTKFVQKGTHIMTFFGTVPVEDAVGDDEDQEGGAS